MIAAVAVEGIAKYVLSADMICQIYNNLIIKSKFGLMNVVIFHRGKQLAARQSTMLEVDHYLKLHIL